MKSFGRRKIIVNIFWIVLGAALFVLSVLGKLSNMYSGMGGGFIGVGIVQLIRGIQYNTSAEYRERYDTEASDERNRFLRMKAWSWAGYMVVILCGAACIVCTISGQEFYATILGFAVCLVLVLYLISYAVVKRKY